MLIIIYLNIVVSNGKDLFMHLIFYTSLVAGNRVTIFIFQLRRHCRNQFKLPQCDYKCLKNEWEKNFISLFIFVFRQLIIEKKNIITGVCKGQIWSDFLSQSSLELFNRYVDCWVMSCANYFLEEIWRKLMAYFSSFFWDFSGYFWIWTSTTFCT